MVQINIIKLIVKFSGLSTTQVRRLLKDGAIWKYCEGLDKLRVLEPIQWITPKAVIKYGKFKSFKVDFTKFIEN